MATASGSRARDFTLNRWVRVLRTAIDAGYRSATVHDFLSSARPESSTLVLRHDVDRAPMDALRMAEAEAGLGLRATYYFRATRSVFFPHLIRRISDLGHEIGYHYETLCDTKGDKPAAYIAFQRNLERFREIAPITTISMHGRPLSPWDSRELWSEFDFERCGILGEAYLSIDYTQLKYFNDTGRTWNPNRYNVRDHVTAVEDFGVDTTDELEACLAEARFAQVCISAHPNRWPAGAIGWAASAAADALINAVKVVLIAARRDTTKTRERTRPR